MKRRFLVLVFLLLFLAGISWVSVVEYSRQRALTDASAGRASEHAGGSAGMNQEGPSNRRSLGERTVNVSALNRSKLTVREGEIGIVRVSAATLNHLMNQQPKEEMDHLNSTGGYGFVGLFRSDQLVEMLGDHGLERSIVSGEESLTALHGHGWGTEVDAVSKDGMTNLNIVTDDGFRAISSSLSIHNGYVVLLSLGNSPQGEPNGGLVYIAGGKGDPNDAQHSLGADPW